MCRVEKFTFFFIRLFITRVWGFQWIPECHFRPSSSLSTELKQRSIISLRATTSNYFSQNMWNLRQQQISTRAAENRLWPNDPLMPHTEQTVVKIFHWAIASLREINEQPPCWEHWKWFMLLVVLRLELICVLDTKTGWDHRDQILYDRCVQKNTLLPV